MHRPRRSLLHALPAVLAVATLCTAPLARTAGAQAPDRFCWRGRPLPACEWFALFEFGYLEPLATTRLREPSIFPDQAPRDEIAFGRQLTWSVGAMRNVGPRTALGGAAVIGAALEAGPYVVATARARRWVAPAASLEVAAGPGAAQVPMPIFVDRSAGPDQWRPALVAEARANFGDLAALTARGIVVPSAGGRRHAGAFVGASTGSWAAAVGTVAAGVLTALAIAALGSAGT
jgi:hypothetical protein